MESFDVFLETDKEDFFNHHYTGFIPSSAYERYEAEGGLSWLGSKSRYHKLIHKEKVGNFDVEFRKSGEVLGYVKHDENDEIARDERGLALSMSPEEIDKKGYPKEDQTIVAFVDDKPIGFISNEFGAVGVWVELPYQKIGIGTKLLYLYMKENPKVISGKNKIGQMTEKGIGMTNKVYDVFEKEKGPNWFSKERNS